MSELPGGRVIDIGGLDLRVHRWFVEHRRTELTRAVLLLTRFGSSPATLSVAGILAPAIVLRHTGSRSRARVEAAATIPMLALCWGSRRAVMMLISRRRPPRSNWAHRASGHSFPSGHSTNAAVAAVWLVGAIRVQRRDRAGRWRWSEGVGAAYVMGVGASRVYLGVHWPSDVVAGWLFGAGWAVLVRRASRVWVCPESRSHHQAL